MRNRLGGPALALACFAVAGCHPVEAQTGGSPAAPALAEGQAEAIFAGGCFWCVESAFEGLPGVIRVTSGYTGGPETHPTYRSVSSGRTGHAEAVRVVYDPTRIRYERLLEVFWHNIDPLSAGGQFCDRGRQYRSAIFAVNAEQRRLAEASRRRVRQRLGRDIVTPVVDARPFWVAEAYHQDYYRKNPARYQRYRRGCGRDRRLRELWGEAGRSH